MKRFLLFFICLIHYICCFGQFKDFTVKASVTFPHIPEQSQHSTAHSVPSYTAYFYGTSNVSVTESFREKAGFQIGGKVDYEITPKFFITTSLNLQHLRYKRSVNVDLGSSSAIVVVMPGDFVHRPMGVIYGFPVTRDPDSGTLLLHPEVTYSKPSDKLGNTELYYLQMPVTAGTYLSRKRLVVRGGLLFSQLISARVQKQSYSYSTGVSEKMENSDDDFTTLSCGAILEISCMLVKNITVDLSVSRNFNAIYIGPEKYSETKLSSLSAGLSYRFSSQKISP
jgi:hypothetical protein